MKKFEIWISGYNTTGDHATATLLGLYNGDTFDDAVEEYKKLHPGEIETTEVYGMRNPEGIMPLIKRHTIWGCTLHDNEKDARQFFG